MKLIIAVRGNVDDNVEAVSILSAVESSLIPFVELDLNVTAEVGEQIVTPS